MTGARLLTAGLLLAGITISGGGCAHLLMRDDAAPARHLPRVKVELPGDPPQRSSAPPWKGGAKSSAPAQAASVESAEKPAANSTESPETELKQLLQQLVAQGKLDRTTQDEVLKNIARTDAATLQSLLWVYRAALRESSSSKPKPESSAVVPASATAPLAENAASAGVQNQPASLTASTASSTGSAVQPAPPAEKSSADRDGDKKTAPEELSMARDWQGELNETIRALEAAAENAAENERARLHASLRILYLTAGRKQEAVKPLPGLDSTHQEFWSKELFGLATYLDPARPVGDPQRAAEASRYLHEAAQQLSAASPLVVRSVAFCNEVSSYGVYTSFPKHDFKPGQQLLLYAEIENFHSSETPKGFHTAFKTHYRILDPQGREVDQHDFALAEEHCQNARRDYFVRYFMTLPSRIYDGRYTLQLTIEDTIGKKVGQASIDFSIKSK